MPDYQALNITLVGAALLFTVGSLGFLLVQSLLTKLLCSGLMGQGILIAFLGFAQFHNSPAGTMSGLLILGLLLAEGVLGLGLLLRLSVIEGIWVNAEDELPEDSISEDVKEFDLILEELTAAPVETSTVARNGDEP